MSQYPTPPHHPDSSEGTYQKNTTIRFFYTNICRISCTSMINAVCTCPSPSVVPLFQQPTPKRQGHDDSLRTQQRQQRHTKQKLCLPFHCASCLLFHRCHHPSWRDFAVARRIVHRHRRQRKGLATVCARDHRSHRAVRDLSQLSPKSLAIHHCSCGPHRFHQTLVDSCASPREPIPIFLLLSSQIHQRDTHDDCLCSQRTKLRD